MSRTPTHSNSFERRDFYWLFLLIAAFLAFFIWVCQDAFFGDAISTVSRAAWNITNSNFTEISYPKGLDPGHPITFPMLYAIVWKLFGAGLPQSHLINFLFSGGILMVVWKWINRENGRNQAWFAVLLLCLIPQFISNIAQMNTHLPLTFFVVGLGYSLRFNRNWGQILFSAAMLITHLQGLYFLAPLWLWWFLEKSNLSYSERLNHAVKILAIPALCFLAWLYYHHSITGWWLSSPDYAGHRGTPPIKRIIINLILSDWRIVDYGQIALFVAPTFFVIKNGFKWTMRHTLSIFFILYFFNAIAISVTTQTGPAHRYLLPCLPFLAMANAQMFNVLKTRTWLFVSVLLFSGNFWFYPGKVMGDATLANRNLNILVDSMESEFPGIQIHSYAPLSNASIFTRLTDKTDDYQPLYGLSIDSVSYIARSNVSGDFPEEQVTTLQQNWSVRTYQKGYVYLELYENPTLSKKRIEKSNYRQIGYFENWMQDMKRTIKGQDAH